jgi:hypothetical protein
MSWGLENEFAYKEDERTIGQNLTTRPPPQGKPYSAFAFQEKNPAVREPYLNCIGTYERLWAEYRKISKQVSRQGFAEFRKSHDVFCPVKLRELAPKLYFDFVGHSKVTYTLEEIRIETLDFTEYRGGGFVEGESAYDLVLSPLKGVKTYRVGKKLNFTHHGRTVLTFWSGNEYPEQGWAAPMGEYLIDIEFVFVVDGERVSVRTGPFKMDV